MPSITIKADIAYDLAYLGKGGRTARQELVHDTVELTVAAISEAEAPPAIEVVTPGGTETLRVREGTVLTRARGRGGRPLGIEDLESKPVGPSLAWQDTPYPFLKRTMSNLFRKDLTRIGDIRLGRILSHDRDEVVAHATAQAARTCILDGEVWVPFGPLSWDVTARPGEKIASVDLGRRSQHEEPGTRTFRFMIGDLAMAEAFVVEVSAFACEAGGDDVPPRTPSPIKVIRPDLVPDSLPDLVRQAVADVAQGVTGEGFHELPEAALEGWLAFRRAARQVEAGDLSATGDAFEGIRTLHAAVPPYVDGVTDPKSVLRWAGRELPLHLAYHDGYLSTLPELAPEAPRTGP